MSEIQVYVHSTNKGEAYDFIVNENIKLLDFRKMVADRVGIPYQNLVLVASKELNYNYTYNSKTLREIGMYDQITLYAVLNVGGGKHIYK